MSVPTSTSAPGVYITEQLAGPTPPPLQTSPSVAGFIGEGLRGPSPAASWSGSAWQVLSGAQTPAVQCNGWGQFVQYFGGFNTGITLAYPNLAYAVYEYFANGGQTAWVARATSSSVPGTSATCTLLDAMSTTPQPTLSLIAGCLGVAGNVGVWGNQLYCDVVPITINNVATSRFNINIYYGGSTAPYLVEQWIDLSMSPTDPRYAVSILNNPIQGSSWVVAGGYSDSSLTYYPGAVTGKQFTGGVDCGDPTFANWVSMITYGNGTSPFDNVPGMLNINLPGMVDATTVLPAAVVYAGARPSTFLVIDTPPGLTPAGAVSFSQSLGTPSSDAAIYYPWTTANNPANPSLQSTISLPPGGFVLGQMVTTDSTLGVWVAPAGVNTVLDNVVRAERLFAPADLGLLNSNNVNALWTMPNGSVVIWGTRTMLQGYATKYVPIRRTLSYIEASLTALLKSFLFQPNDQLLWTNISAVVASFLGGLQSQNAFAGTTAAQSYYVICNSTNNTQQTIQQGVVNVQIGLAFEYPAEFISLLISQFLTTGATTVSTAA